MPALTQKGQVTVPKPVRQLLGLQTGDEVRFVVRGDRVEIQRASTEHRSAFGLLRTRPQQGNAVERDDDAALMDALVEDDARIRGDGG